MRGIDTPIRQIRRRVFEEVARVAFESDNLNDDIEALPYIIAPSDLPTYHESIYRERAIVSERVRLAMGLSLRPDDEPVHLTAGLDASNVAEKYYEPPLMQVIPSACDKCPDNIYEVSNQCRGCMAHPCAEVCPKGAISMVKGQSYIDMEKCIRCGKCKAICPYDAIAKKVRPCSAACGIKAIGTDELGRAKIDDKKCVKCGQCMASCPFGAIADKSQIFQLIQAMKQGPVYVELAPAVIGQFGADVRLWKIKAALKEVGFADVYEVALGAVLAPAHKAEASANEVRGKKPFLPCILLSSSVRSCQKDSAGYGRYSVQCSDADGCHGPDDQAETSRKGRLVFAGPCAAKKLEASRTSVRSDVDFVITFEELAAIFAAKGIDLETYECEEPIHDATGAGRGYAIAGGVASAIEQCIEEYYPGTEVYIEHAEGLSECQKILMLAKAGKKDGCLIEGMGCPGGCVAGVGTNIPIPKATGAVKKFVKDSTTPLPPKEYSKIELP
ncbi:MAG: monomeric [FeFe] hydrogenase [Eubacterium sp.]